MKNQSIIYGIGGLIIGALLTGVLMFSQNKKEPIKSNSMMNHDTSKTDSETNMSMEDMMSGLKGKTGDNFDKTFILEMTEHHQGAIDMAKEAQKSAKHEEIKELAQDIITAQEKEIGQMKDWQKTWEYTK